MNLPVSGFEKGSFERLNIYSLDGQLIYTYNVSKINSQHIQLDKKGVYLLKVEGKVGTAIQKVIIH